MFLGFKKLDAGEMSWLHFPPPEPGSTHMKRHIQKRC